MKVRKIMKITLLSILVLIVLLLMLLMIPHAGGKSVSDEFKEKFDVNDFYAEDTSLTNDFPDRAEVIDNPSRAFDIRIKMIVSAKEKIDFVYLYVTTEKTSKKILGELLNAANRGVKVRLMVDGKRGGLGPGEGTVIAQLLAQHENIEYYEFNNINVFKPQGVNNLLHDKFIVIDNKFHILGGRNVGDRYYNPSDYKSDVTNDRDTFIYNTSYQDSGDVRSSVYLVQEYANKLFHHENTSMKYEKVSKKVLKKIEKQRTEIMGLTDELKIAQPKLYADVTDEEWNRFTVKTNKVSLAHNPLTTGKNEPHLAYTIAQLGLNSKTKVEIQTPYMTANKDLLKVFTDIGKKDIDFEMLTNSMAIAPNIPAFSNYFYNRKKFLKTGIDIFEYNGSDGSHHTKSYFFDGRISAVGSLNLDDRSFYSSTETLLIVDSVEYYERINEKYQSYKKEAIQVGQDNKYLVNDSVSPKKCSVLKEIMMWFASLFSRLFQFMI